MAKHTSKYENEYFFRAPDLTDNGISAGSNNSEQYSSTPIFTSRYPGSSSPVPEFTPSPMPVPDANSRVCYSCRNLVPISDDQFCPYCGNMLD